MGCSVSEAQARITSREFSEWKAYYQMEPFGEERADLRMAQLCALVANKLRAKEEKKYKPDDFMPKFGESLEELLERKGQDVATKFSQIATALNTRK